MAAANFRIAVLGAGAVGGYFGARLAASGASVAFIARGKQLEALSNQGLKVKSIQGDLHIQAPFTSDPNEVGAVDLVLFCVKSYSTDEAGRSLAPLMGEKTIVLSLQNGVDNPDKIARLWGDRRTLAGVVYIAAELLSHGTVGHSAGGRIVLGGLEGGGSEEAGRIVEIFSAAEIPCAVSPEIRKLMWGKLVWNAPFCALSCLTRASAQEIVESESAKQLAIDCMEEVREAARCQGFGLESSVLDDALKLSRGLGDFKPSMLQDLEAGKPLEYEAFNGVVVKSLRQAGRRAPLNEMFYAALKFLDEKNRGAKTGQG